jgi:hypothetical protein
LALFIPLHLSTQLLGEVPEGGRAIVEEHESLPELLHPAKLFSAWGVFGNSNKAFQDAQQNVSVVKIQLPGLSLVVAELRHTCQACQARDLLVNFVDQAQLNQLQRKVIRDRCPSQLINQNAINGVRHYANIQL